MDLIFELIAPRVGYKQSDSFVPEPAAFLPFDLQALERSYGSETNSPLVDRALSALQAALIARQQWRPRAEPLVFSVGSRLAPIAYPVRVFRSQPEAVLA
jgi:hypothetical protein